MGTHAALEEGRVPAQGVFMHGLTGPCHAMHALGSWQCSNVCIEGCLWAALCWLTKTDHATPH